MSMRFGVAAGDGKRAHAGTFWQVAIGDPPRGPRARVPPPRHSPLTPFVSVPLPFPPPWTLLEAGSMERFSAGDFFLV